MEYVGNVAFMVQGSPAFQRVTTEIRMAFQAGYLPNRRRGREYLGLAYLLELYYILQTRDFFCALETPWDSSSCMFRGRADMDDDVPTLCSLSSLQLQFALATYTARGELDVTLQQPSRILIMMLSGWLCDQVGNKTGRGGRRMTGSARRDFFAGRPNLHRPVCARRRDVGSGA